MRNVATAFFLLLIANTALGIEPDANAQIELRARALEQQSQKSLGISILQLALLFEAGKNNYFPKWSLEKSGSWALLQDLDSKGFVNVTAVNKLPDGSVPGEALISYVPTAKGQAIVSAIRGK